MKKILLVMVFVHSGETSFAANAVKLSLSPPSAAATPVFTAPGIRTSAPLLTPMVAGSPLLQPAWASGAAPRPAPLIAAPTPRQELTALHTRLSAAQDEGGATGNVLNETFDGLRLAKDIPAESVTAAFTGLPKDRYYLSPAEAGELARSLNVSPLELLRLLAERGKAMSVPLIGKYPIGAAALGVSGAIYLGGSLEFPGFQWSQAVHAEQAAIASAFSLGETGLAALAVSEAPCGHCRQFMQELISRDKLQVLVKHSEPVSLATLLPMPFGNRGTLLTPQNNSLSLVSPAAPSRAPDVVNAALLAANESHSKYNPAGVALLFADGAIIRGSFIQIAGANMSLSPLQTALVNAVAQGRRYEDIARAALVELNGSLTSHAEMTRAILKSIAPLLNQFDEFFEVSHAQRPPQTTPLK
ncbi:MAG: cytidine deaminase [Elusimicrobia bacterium]|nr:cytidine deaminase [Elusimicrobiota bacterium]